MGDDDTLLILAAIVAASAAKFCLYFVGLSPAAGDGTVLPVDADGEGTTAGAATAGTEVGTAVAGGASLAGDSRTITRKKIFRVPRLMTPPLGMGCNTPGLILLPFNVVPLAEKRSTTCTVFDASTLSGRRASDEERGIQQG